MEFPKYRGSRIKNTPLVSELVPPISLIFLQGDVLYPGRTQCTVFSSMNRGPHPLLGTGAAFEKHTYFRDICVCSKVNYRLFA